MRWRGGSSGHDPSQIEHCEQATAAQRLDFSKFVRAINATPELVGGFAVHRSRLVWQPPLVGGKRALADADGIVRIWCDVCESAHALGQPGDMLGNFKRGHLLKPTHISKALSLFASTGGARAVDALPEAAPADAPIGVTFLPDEAAAPDDVLRLQPLPSLLPSASRSHLLLMATMTTTMAMTRLSRPRPTCSSSRARRRASSTATTSRSCRSRRCAARCRLGLGGCRCRVDERRLRRGGGGGYVCSCCRACCRARRAATSC